MSGDSFRLKVNPILSLRVKEPPPAPPAQSPSRDDTQHSPTQPADDSFSASQKLPSPSQQPLVAARHPADNAAAASPGRKLSWKGSGRRTEGPSLSSNNRGGFGNSTVEPDLLSPQFPASPSSSPERGGSFWAGLNAFVAGGQEAWARITGIEKKQLILAEWETKAEGRNLDVLSQRRGVYGLAVSGRAASALAQAGAWKGDESSDDGSESEEERGRGSRRALRTRGAREDPAASPSHGFRRAGAVLVAGGALVRFDAYLIPLMVFVAINVLAGAAILALSLLHAPKPLVTAVSCWWGFFLSANLILAFFPRIIHRQALLRAWRATVKPMRRRLEEEGECVVVLQGKVSAVMSGSMLDTASRSSSEGALFSETVLREYRLRRAARLFFPKDHLRQVVSTDFILTDKDGAQLLVRAKAACDKGLVTSLLHYSTTVPLSSSRKVTGFSDPDWLDKEQAVLAQKPFLKDSDLVVCRGLIVEGQEIAVMGCLRASATRAGQLVLDPLPAPHNVSSLVLFIWCLIPFCFPSWATGLVFTDNPHSIW